MSNTLIKFFFILCLWVATSGNAVAAKFNVGRLYKQSVSLEKKGRNKKAVKNLKKIIKKYKKFKPAYILLGRIFAKNGKFKTASKYYRRVKFEEFTKRDYFYLGITLYSQKKCAKALEVLSKMSPKDPNFDNGLFYAGVCQFKAQRWEKARKLLGKAKNIVQSLKPTRRKLIVESRKRQQIRSRPVFSQNRYFARRPPPIQQVVIVPYNALPTQTPTQSLKNNFTEKTPETKLKAGHQTQYGPIGGVSIFQTNQSNHGAKENNSTSTEYYLGGNFDWGYRGKSKRGAQPFFGIYGETKFFSKSNSGAELVYTAPRQRPDEIRVTENLTPEAFERRVDLQVRPTASIPLSRSLSGSLEADLLRGFSTEDGSITSGSDLFKLGLGYSKANIEFETSFSHQINYGIDGVSTGGLDHLLVSFDKIWTSFSLNLDYNLNALFIDPESNAIGINQDMRHDVSLGFSVTLDYFSLNFGGSWFSLIPKDETIKIEAYASQAEFTGGVNVPLPIDLSLDGTFSFAISDEYYASGLTSSVQTTSNSEIFNVDASSNAFGFLVALSFNPASFVSASVNYKYTQTAWTVEDTNAIKVFGEETPDAESEFGASIQINYAF